MATNNAYHQCLQEHPPTWVLLTNHDSISDQCYLFLGLLQCFFELVTNLLNLLRSRQNGFSVIISEQSVDDLHE